MQFDVKERLQLSSLLPVKGSNATIRLILEMKLSIPLSDEELSKLNLREKDGRWHWDQGVVSSKEIALGPAALDVFLKVFEQFDKTEEMPVELYPLYERILEEKHALTPKLHEAGAPGA